MAALSEQVAQESWELMFRMLGISTGILADAIAAGGEAWRLSATAISALIEKIRKAREESKTVVNEDGTVALEALARKIVKDKSRLMSISISDEDVTAMKEQFKKSGITFAVYDVGCDDFKIFFFAQSDVLKAEKAIGNAYSKKGLISDLNPDLFFELVDPQNVGTVSGLSDVDLELFRYHAKINGTVFTSIAENGSNTIVYDLDSKAKVQKTLSDVVWDETGPGGDLILKQIQYKISGRKAINLAFLDGEREYYVVNGNPPKDYIHVTAKDFEYYKNEKMVYAIERSHGTFMDHAIQAVNSYENPVIVPSYVFEHSSPEALEKAIEFELAQAFNREVFQKSIDEQMAKRARIEEKMQLDDESQGAFWVFDDSISYSEATIAEKLNDMDDDIKDAIKDYSDRAQQFTFADYKHDEKKLDYLIKKAEAQRNQGYRYAEEPDYDR